MSPPAIGEPRPSAAIGVRQYGRAARRAENLRGASRAERQLARTGAEAEFDEHRLVARPDDRLAVDALERQLAPATARDERSQRLERGIQTPVGGLDERDDPSTAPLDVEHGLGAGKHDICAADP